MKDDDMKTPVFVGDFGSVADIAKAFRVDSHIVETSQILYAAYDIANWEGHALVVFMQDGQLYEVNGSHCSCYGLEGQWEPELTSVAALRLRRGWLYDEAFHATLNAYARTISTEEET